MNDTYQCSICGETFEFVRNSDWNEKKAKEEFHKNFPTSKWENRKVICDDCWNEIKPDSPIYEFN